MTIHRRPEIRFSDAPQGTCRWCGEEILFETGDKKGQANRRRRWHPSCVDIYNSSDPQEARRRIRKRDRGRCADCRVDTYKVRRELKKIGRGRTRAIRERGYKPGQSFWELDHILPLVDGGSHDDENLQTLCTPCHIKKTAAEARARALRNRAATDVDIGESIDSARADTPPITLPKAASERSVRSRIARTEIRPRRAFTELIEAADAVNARAAKLLAEINSS